MIKKNNWKGWLYLAPVIILMAVFTFYPLISSFAIAFLDNYDYTTGRSDGFTFDNFGEVLGITPIYYLNGEPRYYTDVIQYAIPNTLLITFITVPLSIVIALAIAIGLNSIPKFQKFFQTVFFLPYVTNSIAVGMVFAVLFDYQGIINFVIGDMGNPWVDQGAETWRAMIALCIYIIWSSLPFKILIFLSGLAGIDKQYYDAAKIDSAGKFKTLMNVTVPLLSPQILYVMITSFIGAFKEYDSVVGLIGSASTGGAGYNNMYTVVYYIYDCIGTRNFSYASATAVLLFIVILAFTGIQFWVSKKRVHY